MNRKQIPQPDVLATPAPLDLPNRDPRLPTGPIRLGDGPIGLYVQDEDAARLLALLRYAAERLDSGKFSPELKASEPIVRRLLPLLEEGVVGMNRRERLAPRKSDSS